MKLPIHCGQCTRQITDVVEFERHLDFVNVNNSGIYPFQCRNNHDNILVLQHFDHEVLFEIGIQALVDGYYREAISSFSSSLERFYEFFIIIASKLQEISDELFNKTWKNVSSSSERQLGAYVFSYLLVNRKHPSVLASKYRELRNNVIHKGYIPSHDEALNYGDKVYSEIINVLFELLENSENKIIEYWHFVLNNKINKAQSERKNVFIQQADMPLILNWSRLKCEKNEELISLEKRILARPKCFSVTNAA